MKKQTFARFLRAPLSLALAALMLCALFPVCALAVTINPSNSIDNVTLDGMYLGNSGNNVTVSSSGTIMGNNTGSIVANYGTIYRYNTGTVENNYGMISTNDILPSVGIVVNNAQGGTIANNYGVVQHNLQDASQVGMNYGTVLLNDGLVSYNGYGTANPNAVVVTNNGKVGYNFETVVINNGQVAGTIAVPSASGGTQNRSFENYGTVLINAANGEVYANYSSTYGLSGEVTYNYGTVNFAGKDSAVTYNLEGGSALGSADVQGLVTHNFGGAVNDYVTVLNDYAPLTFDFDENVAAMSGVDSGNLLLAPSPEVLQAADTDGNWLSGRLEPIAPTDLKNSDETIWGKLIEAAGNVFDSVKFSVTTLKGWMLNKDSVTVENGSGTESIAVQDKGKNPNPVYGRDYDVSASGLIKGSTVKITPVPDDNQDDNGGGSIGPGSFGGEAYSPMTAVSSTQVEVIFDAAGGRIPGQSGEIYRMLVTPGSLAYFPAAPTREGYRFVRWSCSDPTTWFDSADGVFVTGHSISFTAVWEKV